MYPKTARYSESSVIRRLNGRNIVPKFDHKMMECDSTVLYDFFFIDILVDSNLKLLFVVQNASNGKRDIFDQSY